MSQAYEICDKVTLGGKTMFCENCGKELSDSAKFCSDCGTPTTGEILATTINDEDINNEAQPVNYTHSILTPVEDPEEIKMVLNGIAEKNKKIIALSCYLRKVCYNRNQ